ncbi:alpha/beta hydrolase domain-containing protein [Humidisolicoccus flavus]|uniref:alpha/beta hydrolase domain-containing protein n=1 Tax=Humidisolicoccus flavus TaxID=3111414 RepID=UPI00324A9D47
MLLDNYARELLPLYDYAQSEYLVSGEAAGHSYTTRILVRHPIDMRRFNGRILSEVSHIWGGISVWRAYHRQVMRAGYIWVEIDSQAPSALDLVKNADPERYEAIHFVNDTLASEFKSTIPFTPNPTPETLAAEYDEFKERWWEATPQSFEIIAQVAASLREDLPGLGGSAANTILLAGISQTGGLTRRFIERYHGVLRGENDAPLFDGYLPGASGGDALPDIDVPVIEVLGEAEFQSVRWPCGVSGQVRGLSHRRDDSDTFRLYEVAGMAHRETRRMSAFDVDRLKNSPLPSGANWSSFPNTHIYNALLELLAEWAEGTASPPPSQVLETIGETDEIVRDDVGNAVGGVRSTHTEAPTSTLVAATPMGRPSWYHGNETPLTDDVLRKRYGSVAGYRSEFGRALDKLLDQRLLLPTDAEELRLDAESVNF